MVKLQPRDLKLLQLLSRYGVLSTKQIQKLFFSDIRFTTMMRRLRSLEQSHFLTRGITLTDQSFTWRLGWRGEQQLGVKIPGTFSNRNTIDHDVLVNDIRMKLESFNLAKDWKPEFEIKSELFRNERYKYAKDQLIPDGILYEAKQHKPLTIAIEVELTRKSESRYKDIFYEYYKRQDVNQIWYFVSTIADAQAIFKIAKKVLAFDLRSLWFAIIDDFLKPNNPQVFSVNTGKWLQLSELGFNHYHEKKPAHTPALGVSIQVS